jgi:hypothetical protein
MPDYGCLYAAVFPSLLEQREHARLAPVSITAPAQIDLDQPRRVRSTKSIDTVAVN